ncbi:DUF58 domain-containing protein [Pontibacter sp. G13]|uniref:DUF58 domain-containing protein n=1 Tax=Pontibacter sp. G13 TaxID=3074898 RepID=UPI00288A293C|nr:DUF58 domain-containing protein [Pontibacter sp. G13]WNJ16548.1 DUF58 domain-containing protein [Pontibacter sp. G13]
MKDIIKKVRRLEIKIRKMVDNTFAGEYHSAFKGQGLEFDEVRPYQYGDDIRTIDWNVTAKMGQVFIKKFREEREQTLFVLFDVSGSGDFGPAEENKRLIGMEIASLLAFSALKNNDKFGLATFSDQIETYYKPNKGRKHILKIVQGVLSHQNRSEQTYLGMALDFVKHTLKRRSILIVISDFLDQGYEQSLIQLSKRHEVILIRLFHPNEVFHVGTGIIPVVDIETQQYRWLNAGDMGYRSMLEESFDQIRADLEELSRRNRIDMISVNTQEDYFPVLESFFRTRSQRRESGKSRKKSSKSPQQSRPA